MIPIIAVYLLGLVSAGHALLANRNQHSSLAWCILLLAVPFVSLPVYWLVGRSRMGGYISRRQALKEATSGLKERVAETLRRYQSENDSFHVTHWLTELVATKKNSIELFSDNESAFEAILDALENATKYVLIQFYVIRDDEAGRTLTRSLCAASERGIRVYLYFDPLESDLPMQEKLERSGVEIARHEPERAGWDPIQGNFRNHRKLVVVDGSIALLGGMNVGDNYLSRIDELSPWNDIFLRLQGPAVLNAQLAYYRDFLFATNRRLELDWEVTETDAGDVDVAVLPTDPADIWDCCGLAFVSAVNRARERLILASPYFLPDEKGLAALQGALMRGVRVQVLRPHRTLVKTADLAAWHYIRALLPHGVQFYRQPEGIMHQKVLLVDNDLVLVGSANFDYRSFHLNHELFLWIENSEVNREFERKLLGDLEHFRKLDQAAVEERGLVKKVLTEAASLLTPLL